MHTHLSDIKQKALCQTGIKEESFHVPHNKHRFSKSLFSFKNMFAYRIKLSSDIQRKSAQKIK